MFSTCTNSSGGRVVTKAILRTYLTPKLHNTVTRKEPCQSATQQVSKGELIRESTRDLTSGLVTERVYIDGGYLVRFDKHAA